MSKSGSEDEPLKALVPCPCGCGKSFATENGAAMHAINSEDDEHEAVQGKASAYKRMGKMKAGGT